MTWSGKRAIFVLMSSAAFLASGLVPRDLPAAEADARFVGIWHTSGPKLVYRIFPSKNGQIESEYGFAEAGTFGRFTGRVQGNAITGTLREHGLGASFRIDLVEPDKATFHWRESANDGNRSGQYMMWRVDRDATLNPLAPNLKDQRLRYDLIDRYAREATEQKAGDDWSRSCRRIRSAIEQAGKWTKGWPLPSTILDLGWNDWELGWIEIYYLEAMGMVGRRDLKRPEAKFVHHRFIDLASEPRAGFTRHFTNYRETNEAILKQFHSTANRSAHISGERLVRLYYAMWNLLTSNESRGVIARPVFRDSKRGEEPVIGLYNASHQPVEGSYSIVAYDGERKLAEGRGVVQLPAYEEKLVPVTIHSGYAFFHWQIHLEFVPKGYDRRPIPKDTTQPFFTTVDEFVQLSGQKEAKQDFLDAMLWARVEDAWSEDDLKKYTRAVRDAGGRLFRCCVKPERAEAVRAYVRRYLEPLENPDTRLMPGLPMGESVLELTVDPKQAARVNVGRFPRLDPEIFARAEGELRPAERRRLPARRLGNQKTPARTVKMSAELESGYLKLGTGGHAVIMTGHVSLYDGHVPLGTYSLDGYLNHSERKLPLVTAERMVSFYQDAPSYQIELNLHGYTPPAIGGEIYYKGRPVNPYPPNARSFWNQQ